jgi:alkanesulfonate monooxygenase SsuD/methylene tetrahydromethanopterin reductase-like flavin-dependent oxidoreductase (luciferase family)
LKVGIGLPNTMANEVDRRLMLAWARLAEDAGFHVLGTIDKPNYDSWDPLATLAGVAAATERIRLATTILQLPPRNEVLVAKQAAVIDQLSGGRLDLGLGQGGREDDFEVLGADFRGRGERFERQVGRIREIWRKARDSDSEHGVLGPAPVQEPAPPLSQTTRHANAVPSSSRRVSPMCRAGDSRAEKMRERCNDVAQRTRRRRACAPGRVTGPCFSPSDSLSAWQPHKWSGASGSPTSATRSCSRGFPRRSWSGWKSAASGVGSSRGRSSTSTPSVMLPST